MSSDESRRVVGVLLAVLVLFSLPLLFVFAVMLGYLALPLLWAILVVIVLLGMAVFVTYLLAVPYYMATKPAMVKGAGSYSIRDVKDR